MTNATQNRATTAADQDQPQVQVYDNDAPVASQGVRPTATTPTRTTVPTTTPVDRGVNWGAIILALLIVLALIFLVMWLF